MSNAKRQQLADALLADGMEVAFKLIEDKHALIVALTTNGFTSRSEIDRVYSEFARQLRRIADGIEAGQAAHAAGPGVSLKSSGSA